jgi:hypothetical protein
MLAPALLCYAAFGALCLAMERHQQDVLGRRLGRRWQLTLRVAAVLLLATALMALMSTAGWAMGLAQGVALAMATAGGLVWLLSYWPRVAMSLAGVALPGALAAWLIAGYG